MKKTAQSQQAIALQTAKASLARIQEQKDSSDPALSRSFRGHEDLITSVDFDPKMRQVASCSKDSVVNVWNFKPQQRPFKFTDHKGPVYCVRFSPDGETIVTCGQDRQIRLWNNSVQAKFSVIKAHCGTIRNVSFSSDNSYLLSSSDDKTLKMWRLQDKKFMFSLAGHKNWVRSGVISPDMRLICSGSDDKTVKLWDFNSQTLLNTYNDHQEIVSQVLFHPDGTCIISASHDQKIKITDIRSNRLIQHYNAHDAPINCISVHPTGYYLASAGNDSKVKIWDLRQGRQVYTLYSNDKDITALQFNQSGDYFATGGTQNLCMVWKTNFDSSLKEQVVVEAENDKLKTVEYTSGGLNTSTLFKTNKVASKLEPKLKPKKQVICEERVVHESQLPHEDDLNKGVVYDNKFQQHLPNFSQQSEQHGNDTDFIRVENSELDLHKKSIPFHPSSYQQEIPKQAQTKQYMASPNINEHIEEPENQLTETLAAGMEHIQNRLDSMFSLMTNLDNRVSQQENMKSKNSFNTGGYQTLENNFSLSNTTPYQSKLQTMNFGQSSHDFSLANSLNDRQGTNIFKTGALVNTGSIEAGLVNKYND